MNNVNKDEMICAGEVLKSVYPRLISHYLIKIGVTDEDKHKLVMDLIPEWSQLNEDDKKDVGVTVAGKYRLAKFVALMDGLSDKGTDTVSQ